MLINQITHEHTQLQPPLGFNSLDKNQNLADKAQTGKQANIFGVLHNKFSAASQQ